MKTQTGVSPAFWKGERETREEAAHVKNDERLSVASRESRRGLENAVLGSRRLGGVASDEVVRGLLGSELRDGREDTVGVAGEEDEVLGLVVRESSGLVLNGRRRKTGREGSARLDGRRRRKWKRRRRTPGMNSIG
jgi:hypothetical protein